MIVAPNIHIIPGVTAHPYLLVDTDGLTLIDTGIPGSTGRILGYIRRVGYSARDLKRILLTHADYDHAGSLAALQRATGARVYASLFEARAVAKGQFPRSLRTESPLLRPIFRMAERVGRISPAQVDEYLTDGQVLPVLDALQVVDSRGHTPGHLSFFIPSLGVLFTGDSILSINQHLVGSHGAVTWDQNQADASVRRQLGLTAWVICSGHGQVLRNAIRNLLLLPNPA
jgi:glyoxylase-like metal-dependent hydrolase (beta-lactamase superfamily II)